MPTGHMQLVFNWPFHTYKKDDNIANDDDEDDEDDDDDDDQQSANRFNNKLLANC